MKTSARFPSRWLPLILAAPQLLIVGVFFYAPVLRAFSWSFTLERPFGGEAPFIGLQNYARLMFDASFWRACWVTGVFAIGGCGGALTAALVLAWLLNRAPHGQKILANFLVWPLAVAPAVLGVVLRFVANPEVGPFALLNTLFPNLWHPAVDGAQALLLLTAAFAWTILPFDLVVLLAGLRAVPETYSQAAALDGAGPLRRFIDIEVPLLAPSILFVIIMNMIEAVAGSFGLIQTLTKGGPNGATTTLVYRAFLDGFVGLDLSASSTISMVIIAAVGALTALKFRYAESRITYGR